MGMKLSAIELKGFKSIDGHDGQRIALGDVTVLLGANGSGKSNLVSFFQLLNYMTTGALQQYIGKYGSRQLLFYGPSVTESIAFTLTFTSPEAEDNYEVRLAYGLPDRLFISEEKVSYRKAVSPKPYEYYLASGGAEAGLANDPSRRARGCIAYCQASAFFTFMTHPIPPR